MELLLWIAVGFGLSVRFRARLPDRARGVVERGWGWVLPRLRLLQERLNASNRQRLAVLLVPYWNRAAKGLLWGGGFLWLCWSVAVLDGADLFTPALFFARLAHTLTELLPQPPELTLLGFLALGGGLHLVAGGTAILPRALTLGGIGLLFGGMLIYAVVRLGDPLLMSLLSHLTGLPVINGRYGPTEQDRMAALVIGGSMVMGGLMLLSLVSRLTGGGAVLVGRDGRSRWNAGYFTRGVSRLLLGGDAWDAGLMRDGEIQIGQHVASATDADAPPGERLTYTGNQHMMLFGPTRRGKGTGMVIPTLLRHGGSALIIDPKAQNCAVTARRRFEMGQEVHALNPFGLYGIPSSRFNPLDLLTPDSPTLVSDAVALSEALVFGEPGGRNAHWHESAQDLLAAIMLHVATHARYEGKRTLRSVRMLLTLPPDGFIELVGEMLGNPAADGAIVAKAGRFLEGAEGGQVSNEIRSIQSTAINQTRILDVPQISDCLGASDFAFEDLKRQKMTLYLILPPHQLEPCNRWLRLMVTIALTTLTRTSGQPDKPVLFCLDEAASLGYLRELEKAAGLLAGAGLKLFLVFQDLNQLKMHYRHGWETFLSNAGLVQIMKCNDLTTADYFSKRGGTTTRKSKSETRGHSSTSGTPHGSNTSSWSLTQSEIEDTLIPPTVLFGLPYGRALTFVDDKFPVMAQLVPYYEDASLAGLYDPDPEHMPVGQAKAAVARPELDAAPEGNFS